MIMCMAKKKPAKNRVTSSKVAKIAGRVLEGGAYTDAEVRILAASALAQREDILREVNIAATILTDAIVKDQTIAQQAKLRLARGRR